jgi:hypothetical protein
MSAQIIAALRRRANELYGKSLSARWQGEEIPPEMTPVYRVMAAEFRALADEAEGLDPQPGSDQIKKLGISLGLLGARDAEEEP